MSEVPKRIQRKRTAGSKMPKGAAYVGRPSRWGNPWQPGDSCNMYAPSEGHLWATIQGKAHAAVVFRAWLMGRPDMQEVAKRELAGHDLACWCAEGDSCHADAWLAAANGWPL